MEFASRYHGCPIAYRSFRHSVYPNATALTIRDWCSYLYYRQRPFQLDLMNSAFVVDCEASPRVAISPGDSKTKPEMSFFIVSVSVTTTDLILYACRFYEPVFSLRVIQFWMPVVPEQKRPDSVSVRIPFLDYLFGRS